MKSILFGLITMISIASLQAQQVDHYVAADGSDKAKGGINEPFQTLEKARNEVRKLVRKGLKTNVTVQIRGGSYYLPQGIEFGIKDSGNEEFSITYEAFQDETVQLIGGVKIESWRKDEGEILVADLPKGHDTRQVFNGRARMPLAREPNEGYFKIKNPVDGKLKTEFIYDENDLDLQGVNVKGARIFIWPGYDWFSREKPVAGVDVTQQIIRMFGTQGYDMKTGNRYYINNVRAFLDIPGECYLDSAEGKAYIWPRNNEPVAISTATNVVSIKGTEKRPVQNLHFSGLDIGISEADAVWFENVKNCSLKYSLIENAREDGVEITGLAQGVEIYGNEIRNHGQHGLSLKGRGIPGADVNFGNTIENNNIHNCGRLIGHGYGVRIWQSGKNRIVHNHIHHMPRYGTTIKGVRFQVLTKQVKGLTFENRHDFLHSRENLIAYNHIHHVNLDSQDTGAMESFGSGRDNVYDHNLIHDSGNSQFDTQSGIYLDDASDYFTVTNNIIYGVVGTGGDQCIFAKGIGNRFENNIFVVGPTNVAAIRSRTQGGEQAYGHEYSRNLFYFEPQENQFFSRDKRVIYGFINWSDDRIAKADNNLFWNGGKKILVKGGPGNGDLEKWTSLGWDKDSLVSDPLFVDANNRNFNLSPHSPAHAIGFKSIDVEKIGLKDDFPKRLARD